jgi:MoaA/NifB/PqqE/SkfB family radical SAM enzyme
LRGSFAGRLLVTNYHRLCAIVERPGFPGNASRITVPHLEIHVTHQCNLSCDGCLHFTNHRHSGVVPLEALEKSMGLWNTRLIPRSFALLGGEPCMHPELAEIVRMTARMWPHPRTRKEVVTNGLLLHLHPGLPQALADTGTRLCISIHGDASTSPRYQEKIAPALELARRWRDEHGIELAIEPGMQTWFRGYHGFGSEMLPFEDDDAQQSWDQCTTGKECFQLFEDHLWKCAPLAYLPLQDRKFNLSAKWAPYLQYRPLGAQSTTEEIVAFFNRKAESYCAMCPSAPQEFAKRDPLLPVKFYKAGAAGGASPSSCGGSKSELKTTLRMRGLSGIS